MKPTFGSAAQPTTYSAQPATYSEVVLHSLPYAERLAQLSATEPIRQATLDEQWPRDAISVLAARAIEPVPIIEAEPHHITIEPVPDMEPAPAIETEPDHGSAMPNSWVNPILEPGDDSDDSDDVPPLSTRALAAEARELIGNWSYTRSWLEHLAVHTGWSYNWMCEVLLPAGATEPFGPTGTAEPIGEWSAMDSPPRLRSSSWRLQLQSGNLVPWSYWSSLLEGRWPVSYSIVRLLEKLDQLLICWTITVSASRTLLRRRCWRISLSMGDITPLLIGTFEPHPLSNRTTSGEDDISDDENSFFHHPTDDENCCLCLGVDADDFHERVCLGVCLLWLESYLHPYADAESLENKVFDRRDIGWTSQNTVPQYSQEGLGWARCYWCWCWRFSIGYLVGVGQVADPLCGHCRALNEPPWYPNNRQRAVLYIQHVLGRHENLYSYVLATKAEALAAYLANPGKP